MDWIPDHRGSWRWGRNTDGRFVLLFCRSPPLAVFADRCFSLQPIIAVQNALQPKQIPVALALVMFSQTIGGAMFLSFSVTIFTSSLTSLIARYAPLVDPRAVVDAGATEFWNILSGSDLANVLMAYAMSVDRVFYLCAGAGAACFVFAWGMGWKDIRKKNSASIA